MSRELYETFCGTGLLRLLHLEPYGSDPLSPITCSLHVSSFDEEPKYEALSYMWGNKQTPCNILVDDQLVFVGENLYIALCDLRLWDKRRTLWIDAVCINQDDDEEKLFQIQQMDLVYSKAARVIAYLGRTTQEFPKAERQPAAFLGTSNSAIFARDFMSRELWARFIATNPYWSRLWIVQEICLAKQLFIQIADYIVPLQMFIHWLPILVKATYGTEHYDTCEAGRNLIEKLFNLRLHRTTPAGSLENLIATFRDAQCYNKVDKIYGLMGLANDYNNRDTKQGAAMFGSYNKPRSKVYLETLEHFWLQRNIFSSSGYDRQFDRSMRVMRHSELLLNVLEESFFDEIEEQYHRFQPQPVVCRGEIVGSISCVLKQCNNRHDIEEYFSRIGWKKLLDPFHQRLSILKQNISNLTPEVMAKVTRQLTWGASRSSKAIYASEKWMPSEDGWDRKDIDVDRLGRLTGLRKDTFSPFITDDHYGLLFETVDGLFGLGPPVIHPGDVICRFWNMRGNMGALLRKDDEDEEGSKSDETWRIVGRVLMLEEPVGKVFAAGKDAMIMRMGTDMLRFLSN